ncbi:MAG: cytochrome c [Gemmatimonadota bacterium]
MRVLTVVIGIAFTALLPTARLAAQDADGQAVYREECKSCHGVNGVPPERAVRQYRKIKKLGEDGFVSALSVDSIVKILRHGIDRDMKSFSAKLSEDEIEAVSKYISDLAKKGGS